MPRGIPTSMHKNRPTLKLTSVDLSRDTLRGLPKLQALPID